MRIISKFHDYYDGVQAYGYDPNIVFLRNTKNYNDVCLYEMPSTAKIYSEDYNLIDVYYEYGVIGFCGNIYPFIIVNSKYKKLPVFCYDISNVDKAVKKINNKTMKSCYYMENEKKYFRKRRLKMYSPFSREFINSFLQGNIFISRKPRFIDNKKRQISNFEELKNIFFEFKVPIFLLYNSYLKNDQILKINPNLSEFGFQKVKDPYTAYQEIAQYISGILGVDNPNTVDVSDKDMLYEKGFDDWSFKKEEHPRKPKKKMSKK
ncbi:MAG: hypothetical protein ACOCP4_04110 [Candidatus Woesearchaeota archaeon]